MGEYLPSLSALRAVEAVARHGDRDMKMEDRPFGLSSAFSGEHAWCRDKMMLNEELADGVPLPAFFRDGGFQRPIDRYTEVSGGNDRRAVVSMWSLYYFSGPRTSLKP